MKSRDALLTRIRSIYPEQRELIRQRLREFAAVPASEYFYELAFCLLTPQSSAFHADQAIRRLREASFREVGADPEAILRTPGAYIRFHRTKARRLLELRTTYPEVERMLQTPISSMERRAFLVRKVNGLGMKEATHFLRNIGRNDGLAILDRHILRRLREAGVIRTMPETLPPKVYLRIENRFQQFAASIGIPIDELDLLFWSMATGEILK